MIYNVTVHSTGYQDRLPPSSLLLLPLPSPLPLFSPLEHTSHLTPFALYVCDDNGNVL